MSTRQRKMQSRSRRAAVNYDRAPPLCKNCTGYKPTLSSIGGRFPSLCSINEFETHALAVCDNWTDKHGNTLV